MLIVGVFRIRRCVVCCLLNVIHLSVCLIDRGGVGGGPQQALSLSPCATFASLSFTLCTYTYILILYETESVKRESVMATRLAIAGCAGKGPNLKVLVTRNNAPTDMCLLWHICHNFIIDPFLPPCTYLRKKQKILWQTSIFWKRKCTDLGLGASGTNLFVSQSSARTFGLAYVRVRVRPFIETVQWYSSYLISFKVRLFL